jgi:hypothetical protein
MNTVPQRVYLSDALQLFRGQVQGLVPGEPLPLALAARALA